MKAAVLLITLALFQGAHAQITTPTVRALFGVDADVTANIINGAYANWNDDWYANGTCCGGTFVIDTTGAAAWINLYNSNVQSRRRSFVKKMSQPIYSVVNSRLWYDAIMVRDHHGQDTTAFTSSNKNGQTPALWTGGVQPVPDKNDIKDVMVHVRRDGPYFSDSLYFLAGLSLEGTTGNRYYDFELYQTDMYYNSATGRFENIGPDAGHTAWLFDAAGNVVRAGDIIFTAEFSSSALTNLEARIWIHNSSLSITPANFSWGGAYDGDGGGAAFGYASILPKAGGQFYSGMQSAAGTWAGPFGNVSFNGGISANYNTGQFMEIAVNLTKMGLDPYSLTAISNACGLPFKRLFAKTRAATSFTAELKDFVGPYTFATPEPVGATTDLLMFCGYYYQVSTLSVSNPIASSTYEWRTVDGNILTDPASGPTISVDAPGTYIVTQTLYNGCEPYSIDTITLFRMPSCKLLEKDGVYLSAEKNSDFANLMIKLEAGNISAAVLERSTGGAFTTLATLSPQQLLQGYHYKDFIGNLKGMVSYRLKLTTSGNTVTYSRVVSVTTRSVNGIALLPNPVVDVLELHFPVSAPPAGIRIIDGSGKTMHSQLMQGSGIIRTATWPDGIYFVTLDYGNGISETRKILKR